MQVSIMLPLLASAPAPPLSPDICLGHCLAPIHSHGCIQFNPHGFPAGVGFTPPKLVQYLNHKPGNWNYLDTSFALVKQMVAILCALALTTRKTTDDHLKLLLFWLASQCIRRISLQRALRKRPSPLPSCQDRQDLCIVLQ